MDLPTSKRTKQFRIAVSNPHEFRTAFLAAVARELEYERLVELNVTDNSIVFQGGIFRPKSLAAGTLNYIDHGQIKVTVEEGSATVSYSIRFQHFYVFCLLLFGTIWIAGLLASLFGRHTGNAPSYSQRVWIGIKVGVVVSSWCQIGSPPMGCSFQVPGRPSTVVSLACVTSTVSGILTEI